jgi:hypothetical protein
VILRGTPKAAAKSCILSAGKTSEMATAFWFHQLYKMRINGLFGQHSNGRNLINGFLFDPQFVGFLPLIFWQCSFDFFEVRSTSFSSSIKVMLSSLN